MFRRLPIAALCLAALVALLPPLTAQAGGKKLYKWVDDKGEVHYSDTVPPKASKEARSILNEDGITVDKVQAAKTPEQIAEEKRLAKIRAAQKRIAAEQAAHDRMLLNTFLSEQDIVNMRDAKIATLENLIRISKGTLNSLNEKLASLMKSAADLERAGRKVTPKLVQDMRDVRAKIQRSNRFIAGKRGEQEEIRRQYEKDIQRYRELKAKQNGQ